MDNAKLFLKHTAKSFPGGRKKLQLMLVIQGISTIFIIYCWLWFFGGLIPGFVFHYVDRVVEIHGGEQSVFHYYNDLKQDGFKVRWAHSLNSRDKLSEALAGEAHILEADVMLDGQYTRLQKLTPIMAHPPDSTSELTFRKWLYMIRTSKKGIMLDFKTIEPVELVLQDLRKVTFTRPVLLGADIAVGPGGQPYELDSDTFLRLVTSNYPHSSIVVGWTTNPDPAGIGNSCKTEGYTWSQVLDMARKVSLRHDKQPIIFRFRAACARHSMMQMRWLSETFNATVMVWSAMKDYVKTGDFVFLRAWLPQNHVIYDIPFWLRKEIEEAVNHTSKPMKLVDPGLLGLLDRGSLPLLDNRPVNHLSWTTQGVPGHVLVSNRSVGFLASDAMATSKMPVFTVRADKVIQVTLFVSIAAEKEQHGGIEFQLCKKRKECGVEHSHALKFSLEENKHVSISGRNLKGSFVDKQVPAAPSMTQDSRCYELKLDLSLQKVSWGVWQTLCSSIEYNVLQVVGKVESTLLEPDRFTEKSFHMSLHSIGQSAVAVERFLISQRNSSDSSS